MAKYINETSCPECDDYIRPYGCVNAGCPIRINYGKAWKKGWKMNRDYKAIRRKAAKIANFAHMIILACDKELLCLQEK